MPEPEIFLCPVCNSTGLVRFLHDIGDQKRMPWTKACRCGHGDRYESFMARISQESFVAASARSKRAA